MNENLLAGTTPIKSFFEQSNFIQTVTKITTNYGTLLDHIYVRNCNVVHCDVYDMYFSDHDLVVVGLKI